MLNGGLWKSDQSTFSGAISPKDPTSLRISPAYNVTVKSTLISSFVVWSLKFSKTIYSAFEGFSPSLDCVTLDRGAQDLSSPLSCFSSNTDPLGAMGQPSKHRVCCVGQDTALNRGNGFACLRWNRTMPVDLYSSTPAFLLLLLLFFFLLFIKFAFLIVVITQSLSLKFSIWCAYGLTLGLNLPHLTLRCRCPIPPYILQEILLLMRLSSPIVRVSSSSTGTLISHRLFFLFSFLSLSLAEGEIGDDDDRPLVFIVG